MVFRLCVWCCRLDADTLLVAEEDGAHSEKDKHPYRYSSHDASPEGVLLLGGIVEVILWVEFRWDRDRVFFLFAIALPLVVDTVRSVADVTGWAEVTEEWKAVVFLLASELSTAARLAVGAEFALETIAEEFVSMRAAEMVVSKELDTVVSINMLLNE